MHKHKWTKWKRVSEGKLFLQGDDSYIGDYLVQEKVCEKCGKIKRRTEKNR